MFSYVWPIALVVLSNIVYQICAKSVPGGLNPFAALAVTYSVGAAASVILYYALNKNADIFNIYAYKAGWTVSTASLVQGSVLALALIFVGWLLFKEAITWNKLVGVAICLVGLFFINYKF